MSRSEKLWSETPCEHGMYEMHVHVRGEPDLELSPPCPGGTRTELTPADLVAVVRRGVESGTIKGFIEKIRPHFTHDGEWDWECVPVMGCPSDAEFIVIRLPVSDGGSET